MPTTKSSSHRLAPLALASVLAILIRVLLFYYGFDKSLENDIHFSTPTTSFKRLKEGLFLTRIGQSPYSSSSYLQPPLLLIPFGISNELSEKFEMEQVDLWIDRCIYIVLDLVIAYLIFGLAQNAFESRLIFAYFENQKIENIQESNNLPTLLFLAYLFNPVMIGSCISMSTVIFNNFSIVGALYFATKSNLIMSTLFLAFGTYLNIYPACLLIGVVLILRSIQLRKNQAPSTTVIAFKAILLFTFWISILLLVSVFILDSEINVNNLIMGEILSDKSTQLLQNFIYQCYYYPMSLEDLTPNWGTMWYFFIEVFNDFRTFFLLIFHLHAFAYIIPLTIRFKNDGLFWCVVQIAIISVFKNYPCLGDFYFYMTLLFLFVDVSGYMRYGFFIVSILLATLFLGPICFNTWNFKGTGNANFFYFITLIFLVGNILLIVEFVFARLKAIHEQKKKE